jgi:proline dehydrogenase
MGALSFLARRFVAGETAEAAIAKGGALWQRGIRATFDLLGEDVRDAAAARRIAAANAELLRLIPEPLERNVSVKLTNLGLGVSAQLCEELAAGLLDVARERNGFVRIDMEGSAHTQPTLDVFRRLRARHDNVGIVLQASLHRTREDAQECAARGDRVRLCKGAYKEPASIAWTRMPDVRKSFRECAQLLLAKAPHTAIATHDESLIRQVLELAHARGVGSDRLELQMLLGLRPDAWDTLVRAGHAVRVYVPYGTHWLPYFYRRLRERRENVVFVVRTLLSG